MTFRRDHKVGSSPMACRIQRCGAAFTLIELLVVIGIIALLVGLLFSVLAAVRESAATTACLANLRQIGQAIVIYAADNRNCIIPADLRGDFADPDVRLGNWATILVNGRYLTAPDQTNSEQPAGNSVFRCPRGADFNGFETGAYAASRDSELQAGYWRRQAMSVANDGSLVPGITICTWYGINADYENGESYPTFRIPAEVSRRAVPHKFSQLHAPSELALIYDGFFHHDGQANLMGHARHKGKTVTNYLFADGHADSVPTKRLPASFDLADLAAAPFPKFTLNQP